MHKTKIQLQDIMMVGIGVRTNNAAEMDESKAKIGATVQKYFHSSLSEKIAHRIEPNTTYCVYTEYESDFNGDYTYFIGEKVDSFDNLAEGMTKLNIPSQSYIKFTNGPGPMPSVCIEVWKNVWAMDDVQLGGKRKYVADFEVYDERANDANKVELDIYIGIE